MSNRDLAYEMREAQAYAEQQIAEREQGDRIAYTKSYCRSVVEAVKSGEREALEAYAALHAISEIAAAAKDAIKDNAIGEAEMYDRHEPIVRHGLQLSKRNGAKRKIFTHHPALDALKESTKRAEKYENGEIYTDPNTGETYEVKMHYKYDADGITVKGLKDA